jgi:dTDP-4-amino-4,6-dideoxygalactose transaminase
VSQHQQVPLIKADLPDYQDLEDTFRQMLSSGQVTNFGEYVRSFEEATSTYLGVETRTISSGTTALIFALEAAGGVEGRLVALPSFTFVATAQAVLYAGGSPLFIDIQDDLTMSPEDLENALLEHGDRVAAVVPVHTYGMPCATVAIRQTVEDHAKRTGLTIPVIYDAAHAFGSAINNKRVGGFGTAEIFSLSVTKALVSIEGGLVASTDELIIDRIEKMRNYGIGENYETFYRGMNGKMSELHAAVGLANLDLLDDRLDIRKERAQRYQQLILETTNYQTIPVPSIVRHTFKDFTVLVPSELSHKRDQIMELLEKEGIETRRYFWPPLHQHRKFAPNSQRNLPVTEELGRRVITLPFFTTITDDQIERVVTALQQAERVIA